MSLYTTIRSSHRSPLHRDRPTDDPRSPTTAPVETASSLPRHLLVSLAGITADITSLQQRSVDTPQLHATLERILGRLDGLVDSIYQRAADPAAPSVRHPALVADALAHLPAEMPVKLAPASNAVHRPTPAERSLPVPPSSEALIDHGRRQP